MSTILEELKSKKSVKYTKVSIRLEKEMREKVKYICEKNGISESDYISAIIAKSEVNKIYREMKKEEEINVG